MLAVPSLSSHLSDRRVVQNSRKPLKASQASLHPSWVQAPAGTLLSLCDLVSPGRS